MKKEKNASQQSRRPSQSIPDLEIIDLENDREDFDREDSEKEEKNKKKSGKRFHINIHIVLLATVLLFFAAIIYKFFNWGQFIDLDEIFKDGPGTYEDTYDEILPLTDANGQMLNPDYSDGPTILVFGNSPFSDDRDSRDSLANMIAEKTGGTVYNCSISGSYLAAEQEILDTQEKPMDIYSLYWLTVLATKTNPQFNSRFQNAADTLGDKVPPDAGNAYDTLTSIDFNDVDVITIMYDATDYFMGHGITNFDNATDITQFTGNLEASLELLQKTYPHIRIIVMGPPYAFAIDENGKYVSSDIQRYGQDVLSIYNIMEWNSCAARSVTFVDHLYGTIHEDNAKKYLEDNLHLNKAGRKAVAERFVYALNYFRNMDTEQEADAKQAAP